MGGRIYPTYPSNSPLLGNMRHNIGNSILLSNTGTNKSFSLGQNHCRIVISFDTLELFYHQILSSDTHELFEGAQFRIFKHQTQKTNLLYGGIYHTYKPE